jgi:signal transduction histidine kinase
MNDSLVSNQQELSVALASVKRAHEELKKTQESLIQSEKFASLGVLSAGVAHEINNPLSFIVGNLSVTQKYMQVLYNFHKKIAEQAKLEDFSVDDVRTLVASVKGAPIEEDVVDIFNDIEEGCSRIKKIVSDLKLFSKEEVSQLNVIDVEQLLDSIVNVMWSQVGDKIKLIKNYGKVLKVTGSAQQLGQAFINIIRNAIQAIENSGNIWIKTYMKDNDVYIEIENDGASIPDDVRNKMFDPFFTTKPIGTGPGLGLSVCYEIIKKHNGYIEVRSEKDKTTSFIVVFSDVEKS